MKDFISLKESRVTRFAIWSEKRGALHKKLSFPLRISSVNVTKSTVSCGFGRIY